MIYTLCKVFITYLDVILFLPAGRLVILVFKSEWLFDFHMKIEILYTHNSGLIRGLFIYILRIQTKHFFFADYEKH